MAINLLFFKKVQIMILNDRNSWHSKDIWLTLGHIVDKYLGIRIFMS